MYSDNKLWFTPKESRICLSGTTLSFEPPHSKAQKHLGVHCDSYFLSHLSCLAAVCSINPMVFKSPAS